MLLTAAQQPHCESPMSYAFVPQLQYDALNLPAVAAAREKATNARSQSMAGASTSDSSQGPQTPAMQRLTIRNLSSEPSGAPRKKSAKAVKARARHQTRLDMKGEWWRQA